jgi:phosphoglycerate kinase
VTLRTLEQLGDVDGRRVFVRLDLNVPLAAGAVVDDTRIRACVPTLAELRGRGARLVLASHLGRPHGEVRDDLRLAPVGARLEEIVGAPVTSLQEPAPTTLPDDPLVLLENLRFDRGEEANDPGFAGRLADHVDAYVDDAFGAVHRAHASVDALPDLLLASGRAAVAGRLIQREVEVLGRLLDAPDHPFVAVLGGAKVSDKLAVLGSLIDRVDALLIGGAMAFTLIAARGGRVGASLVEPDRFHEVRAMLARAETSGVPVVTPVDVVAAARPEPGVDATVVAADEIPDERMGLDVGPATVALFRRHLEEAKTVLWNGPMGVFEIGAFAGGTRALAEIVAASAAYSVAGGGDSLAAIHQAGLADAFDHLSTGGGASLEFLEGRALPGLAVLEEATR